MAHRGIAGKIVTPHPFALRYRRANGMHDSRYSAMSRNYLPDFHLSRLRDCAGIPFEFCPGQDAPPRHTGESRYPGCLFWTPAKSCPHSPAET